MSPVLLLVFLVLGCSHLALVHCHLVPEQHMVSKRPTYTDLQTATPSNAPPILIVELYKTVRKNRKTKKPRKKKYRPSIINKRPPPPANCVPLRGNCKSPNNVCCEPCAFCHCRLFRTVCYCRMGYPRC